MNTREIPLISPSDILHARNVLNDLLTFEKRGAIAVKGKVSMNTWFLTGRSAAQTLPTH
jgi:hypothetical protein